MEYEKSCPNMNHGKVNAPVKFCPSCGEVVNKNIQSSCDHEKHAIRRKQRDLYCVDCGHQL